MVDHVEDEGQVLGNYRLMRLLGTGPFAKVYLGEHIHLHTQAAIKIIQLQLRPGDAELFLSEARNIARLRYPSIVPVLEYGVKDGISFLVMDYAPNGSLRQRHSQGFLVSPTTVLAYVKQIAAALQYTHEHKIIHRNIKPANMLLGAHGEVLLSDFGLAVFLDNLHYHEMQERNDTVAYMAPEYLQDEPCLASDQYSLGAVIYEWLTGNQPFPGESFIEVANQHLNVSPPPLRKKVPGLAPDIEEVVLIALAKDPHRRFASIKAFANAFAQACRLELHPIPAANFGILPPVSSESFPSEDPPHFEPATIGSASSNLFTLPAPVPETRTATGPLSRPTPLPFVPETPVPPQLQVPHSRNFSRRAVMVALLGAGVVGGAGASLILEHIFNGLSGASGHTITSAATVATPTPTSSPTPTPSPTPVPQGTILYTYHGHHEVVKAVAWSSPDGNRIASGSFDFTVQIWDATTGDHVLRYSQHTAGVKSVAWSPDGTRIASGSLDKTVHIWDPTNGNDALPPYSGHSQAVRTVAWSPDSSTIASGGEDETVQVWNATTGDNILTYHGHTDKVITVAWSPDGTRIASASFDGTVQIWNVSTQGNIFPFIYHGHFPNGVRAVAWSPDGNYIASGGNDGLVQMWDPKTGKLIHIFQGHTREVEVVAWSPGGNYLASGSFDHTVKIWNAATGLNIYTYTHHTDQVWTVAWSPASQHIASGSVDNTVQIWQAQ